MGIEASREISGIQTTLDIESKRDYLNKRTLDELITICSNMGLDHENLLQGVAKKKKKKALVNSITEKLEKTPMISTVMCVVLSAQINAANVPQLFTALLSIKHRTGLHTSYYAS